MYHLSSPSSSSFNMNPPSPHKRSQHRPSRRSNSPVPRIATLLPHSTNQYSPSSRASDISRLLDPAYSSSTSSSSAGSTSRAYVDHRGDLHDPDYRDFPILSHTKTTRKQRPASGSSARSSSATRAVDNRYYSRPSWERDWNADLVLDDDEEDEHEFDDANTVESHSYAPSRASASYQYHPRTTTSPTRYSPPSYVEPILVSSSPVSISRDNALQLIQSPFEESPFDEEVIEEEQRPKSRRTCLIRRRSSGSKKENEESLEKDESEKVNAEEKQTPVVEDGDFVPSCSHSIRRQWQAFSLRVRFSVFHAKQRLRRSLN